jgi:hypothetical protein
MGVRFLNLAKHEFTLRAKKKNSYTTRYKEVSSSYSAENKVACISICGAFAAVIKAAGADWPLVRQKWGL